MFDPKDIFDLLPTQKITTAELRQGDVVCIRRGWIFVKGTSLFEDHPNNGLNFVIHHFGSGRSYIKPDEEVPILSRDILNKDGIQNIILKLHKEEEEHERRLRENEEEEREMLRRDRDRLNRMLGE